MLDLLKVNRASTDGHGHLLTVTSTVVMTGRWKVVIFETVLLLQWIWNEVRSVT